MVPSAATTGRLMIESASALNRHSSCHGDYEQSRRQAKCVVSLQGHMSSEGARGSSHLLGSKHRPLSDVGTSTDLCCTPAPSPSSPRVELGVGADQRTRRARAPGHLTRGASVFAPVWKQSTVYGLVPGARSGRDAHGLCPTISMVRKVRVE